MLHDMLHGNCKTAIACFHHIKLVSNELLHCAAPSASHERAVQVPGSLPNDPAGFQLQDHFAIATAVSAGDEQPASTQPPPRL